MPINIETIEKLAREELELKKTPRKAKKLKKSNLTHWLVLDHNSNQVSGLFRIQEEAEQFYYNQNILLGSIKKIICFPTISCDCGAQARFVKYKYGKIMYECESGHLTAVSEND